jgi:MFS transporter, DHA1 family, inner membrane transport protein
MLTPAKERLLLGIFALLNFSHIVDFMILMPLGPMFMRIFSLTPQQFGWLVSAYAFSAGVSGLLASMFIDRFDRKKSLLFFFGGFVLATFLCAVSSGFWPLLIARCLTGAFGGVIVSILLSIVSDIIPYERRATAMGVVTTGFALASILGVPFGLYLAQKYDWHTPFVALATFSALLWIGSSLVIPKMTSHISKTHESGLMTLWHIVYHRQHFLAAVFMFCLIMGHFTIIPYLSASLVSNVGLTEAQLPLIYLLGGACSIVAGPLVGRLADHFGKAKVFVIGTSSSLVPIVLITNMTPHPAAYALLLTSIFFITMSGRMVPAMALVSAAGEPAVRGGFMSLISATQQFAGALAAGLAGLIVTKEPVTDRLLNYDKVGYFAIGFSAVALCLHRLVRPRSTAEELARGTE